MVSRTDAATLLQVDQKTVSDARTVQTKGTPEESAAVTEGKASVSTVAKQGRGADWMGAWGGERGATGKGRKVSS